MNSIDEIEIREIKNEEMNNCLNLVWETFLEFEAPDYTQEGIDEFKKSIYDENWIRQRKFIGAFENNKIIGMIATKDSNHIALFFVDGNYHKMGIGRKLYRYIINQNKTGHFTVNSSPYAHEVYKHLGFVDTDVKQSVNGLIFYPMRSDNFFSEDMKDFFTKLLNNYNQTWYDKDIEKVKEFYDTENNKLIYYDNHKNNDTYTLEEHLALISDFFINGKKTESGKVEELIIENFNVFSKGDTACLCFIARYRSFPNPYIRNTMYLEKHNEKWKVLHVHCSFEPQK